MTRHAANLVEALVTIAVIGALWGALARRKATVAQEVDPIQAEKRKRWRRLIAFAAPVAIAFTLIRAVGSSAHDHEADLGDRVAELRKKLPLQYDASTRLDDAFAGDRRVDLVFSYPGVSKAQVDLAAYHAALQRGRAGLCGALLVSELHRQGVLFVYHYRDGAGAPLGHVLLPPSACGGKDPADLDLAIIDAVETVAESGSAPARVPGPAARDGR